MPSLAKSASTQGHGPLSPVLPQRVRDGQTDVVQRALWKIVMFNLLLTEAEQQCFETLPFGLVSVFPPVCWNTLKMDIYNKYIYRERGREEEVCLAVWFQKVPFRFIPHEGCSLKGCGNVSQQRLKHKTEDGLKQRLEKKMKYHFNKVMFLVF